MGKFTSWISAGVDLLIGRACLAFAMSTLALALASVALQVVFRYGLNNSLLWAEELARYAIIWSTFVGAAVAYRQGAHVGLTVLGDALPQMPSRLLARAIHLVVLGFAGLVAWEGWFLFARVLARGEITNGLQTEIAWFYLAIPVGGALLVVAAAEGLVRGRRVVET